MGVVIFVSDSALFIGNGQNYYCFLYIHLVFLHGVILLMKQIVLKVLW